MKQSYSIKNIILLGYRATGKSSIGKNLAEKIGWEFVEIDQLIEQLAGMPISDLTRNGTDWVPFRELEHKILSEVLKMEDMVISAGGGVGVNNIVDETTGETFGNLNKKAIQSSSNTLPILLDGDIEVLLKRIEKVERERLGSRPILNSDLAKEMSEKIEGMGESERVEYMISKILKDARSMYEARKEGYESLSEIKIDCSVDNTVDECVEEIMKLCNVQGK